MLELRIRPFGSEQRELEQLEEWFQAVRPLPCLRLEVRTRISAQVRAEAERFLAALEAERAEPVDAISSRRRNGLRYRAALVAATTGVVIVPAAVFGGVGFAADSLSDIVNSTSQVFSSSHGGGQAAATASSSFSATSSGNGTTTSTTSQSSASSSAPAGTLIESLPALQNTGSGMSDQLALLAQNVLDGITLQASPALQNTGSGMSDQAAALAQDVLETVTVQASPASQSGGGNTSNQVGSFTQSTSTSANQTGRGTTSNVRQQTTTVSQKTSTSASNVRAHTSSSQRAPHRPSPTSTTPSSVKPSGQGSVVTDLGQQAQTNLTQQVQSAVQNGASTPQDLGIPGSQGGTPTLPSPDTVTQVNQTTTQVGPSSIDQSGSLSQVSQSSSVQNRPSGP